MDRRKFLGFFSAAAAAMTVAKSAVGSPTPKATAPLPPAAKKKNPRVAVSAGTSGFTRNLSDAERMIRERLKRCHVESCEAILSATQPQQLRVVYSDRAAPSGMDAEVAKATARARIRECSVSQTADGRNEIEVTWLLVP